MRVTPAQPKPLARPAAQAATVAIARRPAAAAQAPATNGWDRTSYLPPKGAPQLSAADALARGKRVFSISEAASKGEALAVGRFLDANPSRGATQVAFFHAYWAQHQTFLKVPLQAYLYHATSPVDAAGAPKNAMWQAYAEAVRTGAPESVVEEAFLRAHIAEFKAVVKTPEFKQLYALATPKYRQVVEAYLDALTQFEGELDAGEAPAQVGRGVFMNTMLWLQRRKVWDGGFMATAKGLKAMLNPKDALTKQLFGAMGDIAKSMLLNQGADRPAPTQVAVNLTAADAARLSGLTHIPFKAGRQVLTDEMLKGASVADLERRENATAPAKRYPLRMSDFTADQKFRKGQRMAGPDGVMSAAEVEGVVRNVQGLVRSQLIQDFYAKYPVPQAGIHLYSANMLSMNGAYGQSQMANTLADGIMPVDNDGKPKGKFWQAYADAYDSHKATGSPSKEALENLWFKAHMDDFKIVDTPAFQRQLDAFWADAAKDPAFKPMAIYTKAMVGGRQVFEQATKDRVSDEAAFSRGLTHFAKTIAGSGTFPFWQHDLAEAKAWLGNRKGPDLDDRGLPTDKALFERAAVGVKQMTGLDRVLKEGLKQTIANSDDRKTVSKMVDMAKVLTPAQLEQVDPQVLAFYRNPMAFDVQAGIHLPEEGLSKFVLGTLGPIASSLGDIPDRGQGFEAYPLEQSIYRDSKGRTHWDRQVVVDGERRDLFKARFEVEGKQVKETFSVNGVDIALYFDVTPHQGGLKLTLDHGKSSKLAGLSDIEFITTPTATGLKTEGRYTCRQKTDLIKGTVAFRMAPKAA